MNNNPNQNWTDIENINVNDRYELTLIIFNNKDLSTETMKHLFPVRQGILSELHIFIFYTKL